MQNLEHSRSGFLQETDFFNSKDAQKQKSKNVFFLGIGGVSMSALARFSHSLGFAVSGSDRSRQGLSALRREGIRAIFGHRAENLPEGCDLLVYSLAIPADCPEYLAARARGVPAVSRAEYLGALMPLFHHRIGIAGSHGKSTVTAMVERIFSFAYRYPTVFSGAPLSVGSQDSYRPGGRETLIFEACEYKDSFLRFSPTVAVALDLELDHTDYFPSLAALKKSFGAYLSRADLAVLSADDENLKEILPSLTARKVVLFGESARADYRILHPSEDHGYYRFVLSHTGRPIAQISLNVPGRFQMSNAAAAAAVAVESGISPSLAAAALSCFSGIPRRMERIGSFLGRTVYYDYAHHPTEIASVIRAAKQMHGEKITVLFRPHTYTRTQALFAEFAAALSEATSGFLFPIDPVREDPIPGVSSESLAAACGSLLPIPEDLSLPEFLPAALADTEGPILLLGAGDLSGVRSLLCPERA